MKKLLLLVALVAFSFSTYAQTGSKSALIKAGYQTKAKRIGLGLEGRYSVTDNIRVAPDVTVFFPKDHLLGMDINVNAHYLLPLQEGFSFYPLAGIAMINNHYSNDGFSVSTTDFGFNLGAGAEYNLCPTNYVNVEFKYTFTDRDFAVFMLGYGIRF